MPSVAVRILRALEQRLHAINGIAPMVCDVEDRVLLRRPTYHESEGLPAIFVYRKPAGTSRQRQRNSEIADTTVTFGIAGAVSAECEDATLQLEALLADIHRALEKPADKYLRDAVLGRNLLSQELVITAIETAEPVAELPFDLVEVSVECVYPQKYGDPDHVA